MMKIIKRDGRMEGYDEVRVWKAVTKALESVGVEGLNLITQADLVCTRVEEKLEPMNEYAISVEKIHDIVQKELKFINYDAGLSYQNYREKRNEARESQRLTNLDENVLNKHSDRASNGNVDENSFGGKEGLILEGEMEAIALNKMTILHAEKHRAREVYFHDLNKYAFGMHNCLTLDAENLLNEGANVGQGDLRPTKRFSTAMQLIPVYIQIQSMSMFGGCATGHLDFIMQPYIERLIADKYKEVIEVTSGERPNIEKMTIEELFNSCGDKEGSFLCNLIMRRIEEQIHQSCQALITNLVTLQTRGTQTPFSSINFGGNVSKEGQVFNRILLEEMDRGIGRKNKTAIFPILCYYTRSDLNLYEGTPGYNLTIKAIEVQGRRHFPTFVNGDWSLIPYSDDYRNWHCRMGCRTGMTKDINANSPEEEYRQVGRGNFAPHTLCLPIIAAKVKAQGGGLSEFYDLLLEDIEIAKDSLLERYEIAKANSISIAPTMYGSPYGIDTKDAKTPEDFLKHCTFAIGFVGLYETYEILTGRKFYDTEKDLDEAVKIISTINNKAKEYTEKYHLNFSSYGTPAEALVTKVMATLKEVYGYESDRDYVTNSFHVPVWEKMSIFRKIDIESRFSELAPGGSIFHCEIDSVTTNVEASIKILQYAMEKNIPYFRFSHKTCTCMDCGYVLQAQFDICPECGSTNVEMLATITGYLTSELKRMNFGKRNEVLTRAILVDSSINE